jgi:hypothetical protein
VTVRVKTDTSADTFGDNAQYVTWAGLTVAANDVGEKFECPGAADRSVQLTGTLGTGGEVTMQGSNVAAPADAFDSTDWAVLNDLDGNPLTLSAIGELKQVREVSRWIRPFISGGDGSSDLGVAMIARRAS